MTLDKLSLTTSPTAASEQPKNYAGIPMLLRGNRSAVKLEVDTIKQRTDDEARYYNTYKIGKAEAYCLATVSE